MFFLKAVILKAEPCLNGIHSISLVFLKQDFVINQIHQTDPASDDFLIPENFDKGDADAASLPIYNTNPLTQTLSPIKIYDNLADKGRNTASML